MFLLLFHIFSNTLQAIIENGQSKIEINVNNFSTITGEDTTLNSSLFINALPLQDDPDIELSKIIITYTNFSKSDSICITLLAHVFNFIIHIKNFFNINNLEIVINTEEIEIGKFIKPLFLFLGELNKENSDNKITISINSSDSKDNITFDLNDFFNTYYNTCYKLFKNKHPNFNDDLSFFSKNANSTPIGILIENFIKQLDESIFRIIRTAIYFCFIQDNTSK